MDPASLLVTNSDCSPLPPESTERAMDIEYKVVQSQTPMFSDTAKMHQILAEEANAGWQLLEKEDNYKIRLQRNISHRANDAGLGFDAYRTTVGVSSVVTYGATALITLAIVSIILYLAIWSS